MSIDSGDAPPPPPPPPPPPDYSVADQPVIDEGVAAPESVPSSSVDTGVGDGSRTLEGSSALPLADVPMVDEGQAAPDLPTGIDRGTDNLGDSPAGTDQDAHSLNQPENRQTWESTGESPDFPASMQGDLNQLGQDLRNDVDPDAWANADQGDRAAMLANANNTIRESYGLPAGEISYSSDLPEGTTGQYDPNTGDITLNSSLLNDSSPDEAIKTLSHENFHDYQQQAIDGNATDPYAKARTDAWSAGQAGYDSEDFTAYMANPLEADAFAAERAVFDGYRRQ